MLLKFCRENLRTFSADFFGLKTESAKSFTFWMYAWASCASEQLFLFLILTPQCLKLVTLDPFEVPLQL